MANRRTWTRAETAARALEKAHRNTAAAANRLIKAERNGYTSRLPRLQEDLREQQRILYAAWDEMRQVEAEAADEFGFVK